ncbi:MAG TPA: TerB family tellurite resistance protein [Vicinamibacteria bacterium]|nr:TerB family tellurite resistance protein [Vicinamibacteria bacterium]
MERAKELARLGPADRRKLLRFVIATAWADLMVTPREVGFLENLLRKLRLPPDEEAEVLQWLEEPPRPDEVDPATIPREHRELFLETMRGMMQADGHASAEEKESLRLLERLTL